MDDDDDDDVDDDDDDDDEEEDGGGLLGLLAPCDDSNARIRCCMYAGLFIFTINM